MRLTTEKPQITSKDVRNGFVMRYFVQNKSTKKITEVDKASYLQFKSLALYLVLELRWIIVGIDEDIYTKDGSIISGVKHQNTVTIDEYNSIMPGLSQVLKNPLEFFNGTYASDIKVKQANS